MRRPSGDETTTLLSKSVDPRLTGMSYQECHPVSHGVEEVAEILNDDINGLRLEDRDRRSWREWGEIEIPGEALATPLLIVTFSCSLADAITLQRYSTFATSMTGNTVLLAVRSVGSTDKPPLLAAVSLAGFVLAGLISGQVGARWGHFRRDWLMLNFSCQVAVLFVNVVLVSPYTSRVFRPEGELGWIYLLLLAVQGGIQVTQAANSGTREFPTAMMTTPYAALISDPTLFASARHVDVRSRNRRIVYILIFWLGALVGAVLSFHATICAATIAVLFCKLLALLYIAAVEIHPPCIPGGISEHGEYAPSSVESPGAC